MDSVWCGTLSGLDSPIHAHPLSHRRLEMTQLNLNISMSMKNRLIELAIRQMVRDFEKAIDEKLNWERLMLGLPKINPTATWSNEQRMGADHYYH